MTSGEHFMASMSACAFCDQPAQPEHSPCCSSTFHGKSLCCAHYCRAHFVEVGKCSPESHAGLVTP